MTTHRNLKPHYAEPKGKSGPVIVVKKEHEHEFEQQACACGAVCDSDGRVWKLDPRTLVSPRAATGIVVKKGEVMSEPTTEAGKALLRDLGIIVGAIAGSARAPQEAPEIAANLSRRIAQSEQEARANADRELRELLDLAYEMRDDECAGINYGCNSVQAFDAARAERKS